MTSIELAQKLKLEINYIIQPSRSDYAVIELYEDANHLAKCIDPFDTDEYTYNILRKHCPDYPEKHPMDL
jgi:hypothetical protein